MKRTLAGLAAAVALTGLFAQPANAYATDIGAQWGTYADTQINRALALDPGDGRSSAVMSLAIGIAERSALGWNDPAAQHYLQAGETSPYKYGLNYAWDAFQDGTVNPDTTIYTITLAGYGDIILDAYVHGAAPYTAVTDVMRLLIAQPLIGPHTPGYKLAYSNSPNDVKTGYSVHNVNQAVAMFFWHAQSAGVLWSQSQISGWITKLNYTERAAYQPAIKGWAYRDGGSQALQDPDHNGIGAEWGMWWNPSSVGYPVLNYMETHDYGYVAGTTPHATLAAWDCVDSKRWYPQYDTLLADVSFNTFDYAGRVSKPLGYSAIKCVGTSAAARKAAPKVAHFTVLPVLPSHRGRSPHVAPDYMGR